MFSNSCFLVLRGLIWKCFIVWADISTPRPFESPWVHTSRDWALCWSWKQGPPKIFRSCQLGVSDVPKRRTNVWPFCKENSTGWSSFKGWFEEYVLLFIYLCLVLLLLSLLALLLHFCDNAMVKCLLGDCQQRNSWVLHWESISVLNLPWYRQKPFTVPAASCQWNGPLCRWLLGCWDRVFLRVDWMCWYCR